MRKKKELCFKIDIATQRSQLILAGLFVGILLSLFILIFFGTFIRKAQMMKLLKKEQLISQEASEIDALNKKISLLNSKLSALNTLTKRSFLWAEKLNQISDLVLPGIWFTRIYTDGEGRFIIEGSIISRREEAMATVGKLMKDMKENELFFKDFVNIKLESAQRRILDERDIVDFKIALYFK